MSAWKDLELRVCRLLGGERRGPTGVSVSDCVGDIPFEVSVKRSKRGTPEGKWIAQARIFGKREGKPWVLVVGRHNDRDPVAVLSFAELVQLLREAGRLQ